MSDNRSDEGADMKYGLSVVIVALILAACEGGVEDKLRQDCLTVMLDADAQAHFAESGLTEDNICSCTLQHVATFTNDQKRGFATAFATIAEDMKQSEASAEDVVMAMIRKAMLSPGDPEMVTLMASLSLIRETTDDVGRELEATGLCSVPPIEGE